MRVTINNKEIIFPSSLSEFTLGQRIAFHNQYGAELDKMLESIIAMEDGPEKEIEVMNFHFEQTFRTFAFFSGLSLESIKQSEFVDEIMRIYESCTKLLLDQEANLEPQQSFIWKEEEWVLHPPMLKHGDRMKFGEIIDSKQLVKDMIELGKGKWEYMLPICAIYLRKKGEEYQEEFLYEGSDRLKLMEDLPMDIAIQVGFFLTTSLNLYRNTLPSFPSRELSREENTYGTTLINGAG